MANPSSEQPGGKVTPIRPKTLSSYAVSDSKDGPSVDKKGPPNNDGGNGNEPPSDMRERIARLEERLDANLMRIDQTAMRIEKEVRDFRAEMQASLNSTRLLIIGTAISSVVGIWSLNSSMLSGMLGAFDSGRETAKMNSEAGQQAAESLKRSTELIERLEAMSSSKAKDSQASQNK